MHIRIKVYLEQLKDTVRYVCNTLGPKDIALIGSINTLNIGDIVINKVVRNYIETSTRHTVHQYSWRTKNINKYKHILICGGDILHDRNPKNLVRFENLMNNNYQVSFIGVGCPGFFVTEKDQIFSILSKAKIILVRDELSYKRLISFGLKNVVQSYDNAFLLDVSKLPKKNAHKSPRKIGISIKSYQSASANELWTTNKSRDEGINRKISTQETYIKCYSNIIDRLCDNGYEVTIVPFTLDDEQFGRKNFPHVKTIKFSKNEKRFFRLFIEFDSFFFTRYHSAIFSLLTGKLLCGFCYADKLDELVREFDIKSTLNRKQWSNMKITHFELTKPDNLSIEHARKTVEAGLLTVLKD